MDCSPSLTCAEQKNARVDCNLFFFPNLALSLLGPCQIVGAQAPRDMAKKGACASTVHRSGYVSRDASSTAQRRRERDACRRLPRGSPCTRARATAAVCAAQCQKTCPTKRNPVCPPCADAPARAIFSSRLFFHRFHRLVFPFPFLIAPNPSRAAPPSPILHKHKPKGKDDCVRTTKHIRTQNINSASCKRHRAMPR